MIFPPGGRFRSLVLGLSFALFAVPSQSAWAMRNRTIVLRAAGSGALIGLGAGLVSYPFAKSTDTIFAGAVVGALLGTVYGFYLVDRRDEMYRSAGAGSRLDELWAMNAARDAALRREKPAGAGFALPVSVFEF